MERNVTVSVRSLVLAGRGPAALLAACLLGGRRRAGYAGARGRRRRPGRAPARRPTAVPSR